MASLLTDFPGALLSPLLLLVVIGAFGVLSLLALIVMAAEIARDR